MQPRRGDTVEEWLKRRRDEFTDRLSHGFFVLDRMLDDYRLHADTGTPLSEDVSEH